MNKNILFILPFICLCLCFSCDLAESNFGKEKTFVKFYGDNLSNIAIKALPTTDGGYILGGYTIVGDTIAYSEVTKTDLYGNLQWQEVVSPDTNSMQLADMIITQSGEYALLSTVSKRVANGTKHTDFRLTLLDANGQVIWNKDYDVNGTFLIDDEASGITQTADGGFAIIGTTKTSALNTDMFVVRTDENGNTLWDKVYGNTGNLNDEGIAISELPDGTFFWFGTEQISIVRTRIRLVQTNSLGNLLRDFNYMVTDANGQPISSNNTSAGGMHIATSGGSTGIYMTGTVGGTLVVISTNLSGTLRWTLPISNINGNNTGNDLLLSSGGELLVAGEALASIQSGNLYLLRISTTGDIISERTFGAVGKETPASISETSDQGFVIASTVNLDNTNQVMALIKTDFLGRVADK